MASSSCSSIISSTSSTNPLLVLLLAIFCGLQCLSVASLEFQVGGSKGWVVPPPNDTNMYNGWASHNRFHVGDSIHFRYKKDSVMHVGEADYKDCNATHPTFFSNSGYTEFSFQHSGTFYFISGAAGHCEKGQKMVVRVMLTDQDHDKSYGYHDAVSPVGVSGMLFLQLALAWVASYVI